MQARNYLEFSVSYKIAKIFPKIFLGGRGWVAHGAWPPRFRGYAPGPWVSEGLIPSPGGGKHGNASIPRQRTPPPALPGTQSQSVALSMKTRMDSVFPGLLYAKCPLCVQMHPINTPIQPICPALSRPLPLPWIWEAGGQSVVNVQPE